MPWDPADSPSAMPDYLAALNGQQRLAVEHGCESGGPAGGPLLIIAGAGSGKTSTLACRAAHLIANGADPQFERAVTELVAARVEPRQLPLVAGRPAPVCHQSSRRGGRERDVVGNRHRLALGQRRHRQIKALRDEDPVPQPHEPAITC